MEIEKLNEWNPWWENAELINKLRGEYRQEYEQLINSIDIKEITIITGVRRSGKSTIMYHIISNLLKKGISPNQILFVSFDDKKLSQVSLDEIYQEYRKTLNPEKKAYIFFDEIHKKDGWESWIRKKYDLKTNDKFVISGSCSYLLKKEYSTLLTGRNLTFEIFPLDFNEFLLFKEIELNKENVKKGIILEESKINILSNLKGYLELGGFPEIVLKAYKNLNPSLIAVYSCQLAQSFNEFYHSCPVIGSDAEEFRLSLVIAFMQTLKNALWLLGIETIEKM